MNPSGKEGKTKEKFLRQIILRDVGLLVVMLVSVAIFNLLTGKGCIINFILGINCPFCGMTRAHFAALRLDFGAAFSYHPLFFLGLPYLFLLTHEEIFPAKLKKPYWITVITMTVLFVVRYIVSLFL